MRQDTDCVVAPKDTLGILASMKPELAFAKQLLKKKGLNQEDLMVPLGVKTRGAVGHYLSGRRTMSPEQFKALAHALGVTSDELFAGRLNLPATFVIAESVGSYGGSANAQPGPDRVRPFHRVPIVGRARAGDGGYMEEEQYPVGHGNGYLEFPTRDANAFGLLIEGNSMYPRYRHAEFAMVEPNETYHVGEDVYVALNDGRKLIKVLGWDRADAIQLESLNQDHKPIIVMKVDIAAIYACCPASRRHFYPD